MTEGAILNFLSIHYLTSGPADSVLVVEGITWYQNGIVLADTCVKPPCSTDSKNLKT